MSGRNRRKHPRVPARGLAAHLRDGGGSVACVVENISMGGIFLRTDHLHDVGSDVQLTLVRPGWKQALTLRARVTSRVDALEGRLARRMPGMGLQFGAHDDKVHERLRLLLQALGAGDAPEDAEVTLPAETTELELRSLDISEAEYAQFEVEQTPLWKQTELVDMKPPPEPPPPPRSTPPPPPQTPPPLPAAQHEKERLMLQIRGLLLELHERDEEIARLRAEIARLRQ